MTAAAEQPRAADREFLPTLAETRELAVRHNLIPLHQTFIDDTQTPVSAFLKLRDANGPSFLLESAEQGRVGRYSFIGVRPRKVLRWSLGDPGDPYALAGAGRDRFSPGRRAGPSPRARGGPPGRAEPRSGRRPGPRADADRRAGRVRPPQAHRDDPRQRPRRRR